MGITTSVGEETRQAVRSLWRARGFTLAAVVTLAVGLAGTTVMFALVDRVLLQPLPVHDQERLIVAWKKTPTGSHMHMPFMAEAIEDVKHRSTLFEGVAAFAYNGAMQFAAGENGAASYIRAGAVSGTFFPVLGTQPRIGRTLAPEDDVEGAAPVIVIDERLWRQRYGAREDVVGRRLQIVSQEFTIVGVVPAIDLPRGAEAWITIRGHASGRSSPQARASIGQHHDLLARLSPGVTLAGAEAELGGLTTEFERRFGRQLLPEVRSYPEEVTGAVRTPVLLLFGAVALVWLIACANLANLLLMRSEARRNELAIRAALGAGRGRLARLVMTETFAIGVTAAALAIVIASWGLHALLPFTPVDLPRILSEVRIDARVAGFTVAMALLAAAGAGLSAALLSPRGIADHLRSVRDVSPAFQHSRRALVVAQVALSITILATAGVLGRTLMALQSAEKGVAAEQLVFADLLLPQPEYEDMARVRPFMEALAREVQAIPGVQAVTPIAVGPYAGLSGWDTPRWVAEGQSADDAATNPGFDLQSVYPGHFDTLGIRIVSGRALDATDTPSTPAAAVISEDIARRIWPGHTAVGKRLKMGGVDSPAPWYTVVGVAETTRYRELAAPRPALYLPAAQFVDGHDVLAIRTSTPLGTLAGALRDRVRRADPDVLVVRLEPFSTFLSGPLARPRFLAWIGNIFAGIALSLAAIGLYAVMAAFVRHRNREIGMRVALGATRMDIRRLVAGEALRLAGIGAALGLAGAVASSGVLRGLVFGVEPVDPWSLTAAVALLLTISLIACALPLRRAARINPVDLLRAE